jgi:F1F0 ATPase subunit 2
MHEGRKKGLLFEKRSKNFCELAYALRHRVCQNNKSFLVLFFKKELPSLLAVPTMLISLTAGLCLGLLYFGGLWWNAHLLAEPGRMRVALAVMAGRFAMLGGALALAAWQGAQPLLAMAAGILVARFLVMHRVRAVT